MLENNKHTCASTKFIQLSIINNKIDSIPDLHKIIFEYVKRVRIMEKTILMFRDEDNNRNIGNIEKIIDSYVDRVDCIKRRLFGDSDDIYNKLLIKHKCIMAPILQTYRTRCNEFVIYVPDLYRLNIKKSDHPISNLLLSDGYIQREITEYKSYHLAGFTQSDLNKKITLITYIKKRCY